MKNECYSRGSWEWLSETEAVIVSLKFAVFGCWKYTVHGETRAIVSSSKQVHVGVV